MKIVLNRKYKIEQISLIFIFVMGLFSNYLGYSNIWNLLLFVDFLMLIIKSKKFRKNFFSYDILLWLVLLFGFILINVLFSGSFNVHMFYDNMMKLIKTLLSSLIIIIIITENPKQFVENIYNNRNIFNVIWIINLFILTFQVLGIPIFIKSAWMISNTFYEDNCTGIFGFSGTHILTFFGMFVFVLNLYATDILEKQSSKIKIFNIVTVIWNMILSTMNDNTTIFILYVFFFFIYKYSYSICNNTGISKKMMTFFKSIFFVVIGIVILYLIPVTREFINETIITKVVSTVSFKNSYINGSNERLAIVDTALRNEFGWKLGLGLGSNYWVTTDIFYGFRHFGISSIGSFVFLGGIWFYIFISAMYLMLFMKLWNNNRRPKTLYKIVLLLFLVFVSSFSTIYTFTLCMIWLVMCIVVIHNIRK